MARHLRECDWKSRKRHNAKAHQILSSCFGLSFWPVPTTAAMLSKLAAKLGDPTGVSSYWYVPAYTTGNALGFLLAGANSDLFGRRLFL